MFVQIKGFAKIDIDKVLMFFTFEQESGVSVLIIYMITMDHNKAVIRGL